MDKRIAFFILSMSLFFIVIGVLCMDIPMYFGSDWEFIPLNQFVENTWFGFLIIAVSLLIEYCTYKYLEVGWNHTAPELSVEIIEKDELNYDLLMFIASFFLPLVSFQLDKASHWIVLGILFFCIGKIFCTSKGFYNNPTLALLGFHFYKLKVKTKAVDKPKSEIDLIIICKEELKETKQVKYVKLSEGIGYAFKF